MSRLQSRAAMRWLYMIRLCKAPVTFADARRIIPAHCALDREELRHNMSRGEPCWLIDMRNTIGHKNSMFRYSGHAVTLSQRGQELAKFVGDQQLAQVIRLKKAAEAV